MPQFNIFYIGSKNFSELLPQQIDKTREQLQLHTESIPPVGFAPVQSTTTEIEVLLLVGK